MPEVELDKCQSCGHLTPYTRDKHIDARHGHFEGGGQTCPYGCEDHKADGMNCSICAARAAAGTITKPKPALPGHCRYCGQSTAAEDNERLFGDDHIEHIPRETSRIATS